jgi:hypothetical protein
LPAVAPPEASLTTTSWKLADWTATHNDEEIGVSYVGPRIIVTTKIMDATLGIAGHERRGSSLAWVSGDEVYGNHRGLRVGLKPGEVAQGPAIKSNEPLWVGLRQVRTAQLAAQAPWKRGSLSARARGQGASVHQRGKVAPTGRADTTDRAGSPTPFVPAGLDASGAGGFGPSLVSLETQASSPS